MEAAKGAGYRQKQVRSRIGEAEDSGDCQRGCREQQESEERQLNCTALEGLWRGKSLTQP